MWSVDSTRLRTGSNQFSVIGISCESLVTAILDFLTWFSGIQSQLLNLLLKRSLYEIFMFNDIGFLSLYTSYVFKK